MRPAVQVAAVVLGVGLVAAVRVTPPGDLGTWAPGPLSGEVVLALVAGPDGVLVGTSRGLTLLTPDGAVRDLGVPGPVRALTASPLGTYAGTDAGLLQVAGTGTWPGTPVPDPALAGVAVSGLAVRDGEVLAGTETGLHQRSTGGVWQRLWPPPDAPAAPVGAVLAAQDGVLFAAPDGLARLDQDGDVRIVHPGVDVVSLHDDPHAGRVWAGTRGGPLLLVSSDGGRSWQPRAQGLGLSSVEALVRSPAPAGSDEQADTALVVGGSGLADGTGNAGTQTSLDGGRTWQARQDRLSNTHVYALVDRSEPWQVEVALAGTTGSWSLPLPVATSRLYAGTNGGGVSTQRPTSPLLEALSGASPVLRLAEPLLVGALVLACLLPAYRHLWRRGAQAPRPPPGSRARVPEPAARPDRVLASTPDPADPPHQLEETA